MSRRFPMTRLGAVVLVVLLAALAGHTSDTVLADPSSMSWDLYMDDPAGACPGAGGANDDDGLIETGECPDVVSNFWLQPEGGVGGSQSLADVANVMWTTGPLGGDATGDGIADPTHGLALNRPATLGATVGEVEFWVNSNLSLGTVATNNVDDVVANADDTVTGQPPPCGNVSADTVELSDEFDLWNAIVDDSNGTVSHLDYSDGPKPDTQDPDPPNPSGCDVTGAIPGNDCAPKGVRLLPAPIPAIETAVGLTPSSAVSRSFGIAKLEIAAGISVDVDVNLLVYSLHPLGGELGMDGYLNLTLVGYPGAAQPDPTDPGYEPLSQTVHLCPPFWSSPALIYGVTTDSDFDEDGVNDFAVTPELSRLIIGTGESYSYAIHKSTDEDYDGDTIPAYADRCDIDPATGTATDDIDGDTMTGFCEYSGAGNGEGNNPGPYNSSPPWGPGQDVDGDTYLNSVDNCPMVADRDLDGVTVVDYQRDSDGDTVGDVCELDIGTYTPNEEFIAGDGSGYAWPAPGVYVENPNVCNDRWSVGQEEPAGEDGDVFYKYCLAPESVATEDPYANPALHHLRLIGYKDADNDARPDFWDGITSACSADATWCPNEDPHPYDYYDPSDADDDGHSDGCESYRGSDSLDNSSTPGPPSSILRDCDGDTAHDLDEVVAGTNPLDGIDSDGTGYCDDAEETGMGLDPTRWYDFYDVPVPARSDPLGNGVRNGSVDITDVLAVLYYSGAFQTFVCGDFPNGNGVDYDCDKNQDGVPDGVDYDRSPGDPGTSAPDAGPPNTAIDISDALAALAQTNLPDCPPKGVD